MNQGKLFVPADPPSLQKRAQLAVSMPDFAALQLCCHVDVSHISAGSAQIVTFVVNAVFFDHTTVLWQYLH